MALVAVSGGAPESAASVFGELRESLASARAEVEAYEKEREGLIESAARGARGELRQAKAELGKLEAAVRAQAAVLEEEREIAALERARSDLQPALDRLEERRRREGTDAASVAEAWRRFARFGLAFDGTSDGALRLTFTLLDKRDPGRQFWVSLLVDDTDRYRVRETFPTLRRRDVDHLLDHVNRTNDFSRFVRTLRRLFQAAVLVRDDGEQP